MHILITDSGVGGLSVCAYAERFIRTHGATQPITLTFANAAPENDYGYNSMPTRAEKLDTFDRFLRNVSDRFEPDMIYVACNTLSVMMPDTPFVSTGQVRVKGIVETGVELLLAALSSDRPSVAIIFGTQTTIDAGTYPRLLIEQGIDATRVVSQACPGLADTISEDREGARTAAEIRTWVETALAKLPDRNVPVIASLNCTHYGYRKEDFAAAFAAAGVNATVINPNESAVRDLFPEGSRDAGAHGEAEVRFVTRYRIPEETQEALSFFLADVSPKTVRAMKEFEHHPDLF